MTKTPWGDSGFVPEKPSYISPSGVTEIRLLPNLPCGEITHAFTPPHQVSRPASVENIDEFWYILEGEGQLWRHDSSEEVTDLFPTRSVAMAAGVDFQYKTEATALTFLVATAPRWEAGRYHDAPTGYWNRDGLPDHEPVLCTARNCGTRDLSAEPDKVAPDGSILRLLVGLPSGGLSHCTLQAGVVSQAVFHRTIEEIWYVLSGTGEIARWTSKGDGGKIEARPGLCLTIPVGVRFQFRAKQEPLCLIIGTFPAWPGDDEAAARHTSSASESFFGWPGPRRPDGIT